MNGLLSEMRYILSYSLHTTVNLDQKYTKNIQKILKDFHLKYSFASIGNAFPCILNPYALNIVIYTIQRFPNTSTSLSLSSLDRLFSVTVLSSSGRLNNFKQNP